jgi:5-methyltetrahydropteroyltriglutamate--homocysteine methyltransferase
MPRIQTTVVGSYPMPDWLVAAHRAGADRRDRVVIDTQEQCGVDVVCDGELYRFDINHPETNGMIEYFVRPMDGITQRFTFDDLIAYRVQPA